MRVYAQYYFDNDTIITVVKKWVIFYGADFDLPNFDSYFLSTFNFCFFLWQFPLVIISLWSLIYSSLLLLGCGSWAEKQWLGKLSEKAWYWKTRNFWWTHDWKHVYKLNSLKWQQWIANIRDNDEGYILNETQNRILFCLVVAWLSLLSALPTKQCEPLVLQKAKSYLEPCLLLTFWILTEQCFYC